jgi:hypothetical protein
MGTRWLNGRRLIGKGADFDHDTAWNTIVEAVGFGPTALQGGWGRGVETGVQKALVQLVYSRFGVLKETDVEELGVGFRAYNFVVGENQIEVVLSDENGEGTGPALVHEAEAEGLLKEAGELRHVEDGDVDVIECCLWLGHDAIS